MKTLKLSLIFLSFIYNGILWGILFSLPSVSLAEPYECREIDSVVSVEDEIEAKAGHGDKDLKTLADNDGRHICFLTSVDMNDLSKNKAWGGCLVYIDGSKWFLEAYTDGDGDQNVECMAECFEWKYE